MKIKLDDFGRVVIPKEMRDALGLRKGSALELVQEDQKIIMFPVREKPVLKYEGKVLVYTGELEEDPTLSIERLRNKRIKDLSGL